MVAVCRRHLHPFSRHRHRYAVYQRFGNVLSGVYSYALSPGVPVAVQQAFVLHAAEASAKALRGATPPSGPAA